MPAETIANYRLTDNVTRIVLPNGQTVLLKESRNAPVVSSIISTRIGYFHEPDKWNGIAHVIEHMLFKGTPSRPDQEQFASEIRDLGGSLNAGTYYEETYYYVTVPAQNLAKALEIQADAFRNALFDAAELASEIEVIIQESQQKRDNPGAMLYESLYELHFDQHRIRRWRIGHEETLRALTRDDLASFYAQTYRPENLTFTLVGDFETEQALALVKQFWADMAKGTLEKTHSPEEPARDSFRYRRLTGVTQQRLLLMTLPAPDVLHTDGVPLMVMTSLLSDGRSALLFRSLKEEKRIVNSVWAGYEGFEQMGLLTLGLESIAEDPLPAAVEMWREVQKLCTNPVAEADLERIKTRVETRRLSSQEEVYGMARTLTVYENLGDLTLADSLLEQIRSVTPADIQRVARKYLRLEGAALMEYLPLETPLVERTVDEVEVTLREAEVKDESEKQNEQVGREALETTPIPSFGTTPVKTTSPSSGDASGNLVAGKSSLTSAKEVMLPGGGRMLYKHRDDLPFVAIQTLFLGGKRSESRLNSGITNLMLKTSLKGAAGRSAEEIANRIESLGSGIGTSLSTDYFGYGIKLRTETLAEGFPLFAATLTSPDFPEEEMVREKQSMQAELRRQQDNNFSLAFDLLCATTFGAEHPYGLPAIGIAESFLALTIGDLRNWWSLFVTQENLTVSVVGAISMDEATALFANLLPSSSGKPIMVLPSFAPEASLREGVLHLPKKQTAATLGFPGASVSHPDRVALDVLNEITSGMGGRFFRTVRGDNALAYQVTSFHRSRQGAGQFVAYTATAPENEEKARELLLAEITKIQREGVTAEELAQAKAVVQGEHTIGTQSFGAQSGELAVVGVYGMSPEEPQRYLAEVMKITADEVQAVALKYLQTDLYRTGIVRGTGE